MNCQSHKKTVVAQVTHKTKQTSTRDAIEKHIQSQGGRAKIPMIISTCIYWCIFIAEPSWLFVHKERAILRPGTGDCNIHSNNHHSRCGRRTYGTYHTELLFNNKWLSSYNRWVDIHDIDYVFKISSIVCPLTYIQYIAWCVI